MKELCRHHLIRGFLLGNLIIFAAPVESKGFLLACRIFFEKISFTLQKSGASQVEKTWLGLKSDYLKLWHSLSKEDRAVLD